MAQLKAARVADVPTLDVVTPGLVVAAGGADAAAAARALGGRFSVIGHRGKGMNALASPDRRLQEVRENTVRSFNAAARFPVDYVEFDVQVETLARFPPLVALFFPPSSRTPKKRRERARDKRGSSGIALLPARALGACEPPRRGCSPARWRWAGSGWPGSCLTGTADPPMLAR